MTVIMVEMVVVVETQMRWDIRELVEEVVVAVSQVYKVKVAHVMQDNLVVVVVVVLVHQIMKWVEVRVTKDMVEELEFIFTPVRVEEWDKLDKQIVGDYRPQVVMVPTL